MIEQGTVVELKDGKAVVEMGASSCCARCGVCSAAGSGKVRFEADAPVDVIVGDSVEVDVPVSRTQAALTVYLIPLGALLAGAILGNWLSDTYWPKSRFPGLLAILFGLGFVVIAFLCIGIHERRAAKSRRLPTIRKID